MNRCDWAVKNQIDTDYHDTEWGVPVHDDRLLFEMLTLEGAQAGLSWTTILKKRDGYTKAFENFHPEKIVNFSEEKILELIENKEIIRNKLKIRSTITNAEKFLEVQSKYGSFDSYIWSFVDGKPINNKWEKMSEVPASTPLSDKISKDLKKKGFKFIGTTIIYAYLQGIGIVNDHLVSCFRHDEIIKMQ